MATSNSTTSAAAAHRYTRAVAALVEAQTMAASIRALADGMLEAATTEWHPVIEAILACTQRLDVSVIPAVEEAA